MADPALLESEIGEGFGMSAGRKNVITNNVTAENLSSKQVMLTPIKHEDIESNMLNDAYLFGSQLGVTVDETAALIPPNLRVNSSRKEPRQAHSNNDKVSNPASTSKHNSLTSNPLTDKYKDNSPRLDMRLPPDLEKTMLAAQGKLAYVSPTVRQSNNLNRHTFHGSTSQSQKQSSGSGNLGFVSRQTGGSMSQLSPAQPQLQLGQPTVLLNPASQVDLHRYASPSFRFKRLFCNADLDLPLSIRLTNRKLCVRCGKVEAFPKDSHTFVRKIVVKKKLCTRQIICYLI